MPYACRVILTLLPKPPEWDSNLVRVGPSSGRGSSAFLRDQIHRISFHFPPKHASSLNQIVIWFSILARKLLRCASFNSKKHWKARIEAFIAFFNRTFAKSFKSTMTGKPLAAQLYK